MGFRMSIGVRVKLFATFRDIAGGQGVVDVRLSREATLKDLIEELSKLFGKEIENVLLDPKTGSLKSFNNVLVNGHNVKLLQELRTKLDNGDTVALFPPVGGG